MNKHRFKNVFSRYILQRLPLYLAEKRPFYRYILQRLPLYLAEITVISCRDFIAKNHEGDLMRSYENHKRSHEMGLCRPRLTRGDMPFKENKKGRRKRIFLFGLSYSGALWHSKLLLNR